MTIGPGEMFEKAIVYLLDQSLGHKNVSGLELVGISRVTDPSHLAIGNNSTSLSVSDIKSIGTSPTNQKINEFRNNLIEKSNLPEGHVKDLISNLDVTTNVDNEKTYEGGCQFLLNWYQMTFQT